MTNCFASLSNNRSSDISSKQAVFVASNSLRGAVPMGPGMDLPMGAHRRALVTEHKISFGHVETPLIEVVGHDAQGS